METPEPTITNEALALAERRAAQDAELMATLSDRAKAVAAEREDAEDNLQERRRVSHRERVQAAQNAALISALGQVPLNRKQRRANVKAFAKMLKIASQNGSS
jgi:hypothetical protein